MTLQHHDACLVFSLPESFEPRPCRHDSLDQRLWVDQPITISQEDTAIRHLADRWAKLRKMMTRAHMLWHWRFRQHGQMVAMPAESDYQQLTGEQQSFKDYLLNGPDLSGLDLTRDQSPMREVNLEGFSTNARGGEHDE